MRVPILETILVAVPACFTLAGPAAAADVNVNVGTPDQSTSVVVHPPGPPSQPSVVVQPPPPSAAAPRASRSIGPQ